MLPMESLSRRMLAALLMACLGTMCLYYFSANRDTYSDPFCSLIVSQSILENSTIKLDSYSNMLPGDKCAHEVRGHRYDFFPPGTALLSTPFIYMANSLGFDMLSIKDNSLWQMILTMLISPAILLLLFFTGRFSVSGRSSFIISVIFFWGSPLTSSLGTALWSHSFSILFISASIYLLSRLENAQSRPAQHYLLGSFLFTAFFCRPTASLFIISVFLYLALRHRRALTRAALVSSLMMMLFIWFSWAEYGMLLPPYYLHRMGADNPFLKTLFCQVLSPSRGLFVFSPFLLIVLAGVFAYSRKLIREPLFLAMALWSLAHLVSTVLVPEWYGGDSFGPRLQVDALPAWAVMSFILWRRISSHSSPYRLQVAYTAFMALGFLGILINSYSGLFNTMTRSWSTSSYLDPSEGYAARPYDIFMDWRFPQFLATPDQFRRIETQYYEEIFGKGNVEVTIRMQKVLSPLTSRVKEIPLTDIALSPRE